MNMRFHTAVSSLKRYLGDPEGESYYPESSRKSRLRIRLELLWWLLRYREINHYYFLYGKDCIACQKINQLPKKVFCCFRDLVNAVGIVGDYRANYNAILQDKFIFSQYMKGLGIPSPEVVALCTPVDIRWLDSDCIEPFEDLVRHEGLDVFIKEVLGTQGDGVYGVQVQQGRVWINGECASIHKLQGMLKAQCVVQRRICQHPRLEELYPWSVNTIRFLSVLDAGEVRVLAAMLRLGNRKRVYDNLSAGGIGVGIDRNSGRLYPQGFLKPGFGKIVTAHPDTGVVFDGFEVPFFREAIGLVHRIHSNFYATHSVGWDIAITSEGPTVLEGNTSWEIPMLQLHEPDLLLRFLETIKNNPLMKKAPRSIRKLVWS